MPRGGYYSDRYGRPYSYGGRPYYHRWDDCDYYYSRYGYWYGPGYCDRWDYDQEYCY